MFSVHRDVAGHMGDLSANQAFWQLVSSHLTGLINPKWGKLTPYLLISEIVPAILNVVRWSPKLVSVLRTV
jgi:hypothetical protein